MSRRVLDETRVGEYKSNWFLQLIHLILSLVGIVSIFILPMLFKTETIIEMSHVNVYVESNSLTVFDLLKENNFNSIQSIVCLSLTIYFAVIFINSFINIAIPKLNKGSFVKYSRIIDIVLSILIIVILSYYLLVPSYSLVLFDKSLQFYLTCFVSIGLLVNLILMNSILVCFSSKKVSIYD